MHDDPRPFPMRHRRSRLRSLPASAPHRPASDEGGIALISAVFIMFLVGMLLFAFAVETQGDLGFGTLNRNSMVAMDLADAGAQEALSRLAAFGYTAGVTVSSFTNSLAAATPGATGTVNFQAVEQSNPSLLPVLSTATFGGVQRRVRLLVNINVNPWEYQIYGQGVNFDGDTTPSTGNDIYSNSTVEFENYGYSPLCAATATALNLVSPQVMAGAIVYGEAAGSATTPPCGSPTNAGTYFGECQDLQTYFQVIQQGKGLSGPLPTSGAGYPAIGEVAPTSCKQDGNRSTSNTAGGMTTIALGQSYTEPVNWHPMTPQGMTSTDFTNIIKDWNKGTLPAGVGVVQASQTNASGAQSGVTYASNGTYTPTYWSSVPATNGKMMLVYATAPFCVNTSTGAVTLASGNPCAGGSDYYGYNGNINGSSNNSSDDTATFPERYFDWGLVIDDLSRTVPATFYGTGNQNGIRYIPIYPIISALSYACTENVNPGTNIFDNVNGNSQHCSSPPTTTINSQNVTFSGTKASPESLVISNNTGGGQVVDITGSVHGQSSGSNCNGINPPFSSGNWGVILATGDIEIEGNFVFSGYIYAQGNITQGSGSNWAWLNGGLQGKQQTSPQAQGFLDLNNKSGFVGLCGGQAPTLGTPLLTNYLGVSWQDVPLDQP